MALAGEGVVAIWNDIREEARADFFEWHNREHMPERVGIPGFVRGRRFSAVEAAPEFFTLYETVSPQVLSGADYTARLNNPTPWTKRCSAAFVNASRSLCAVALSLGTGQGGLAYTIRYDVAEGREQEQRDLLTTRLLPVIAGKPGVCGAHLCVADRGASAIETAEKKVRAEKAKVWNWILFVEGASGAPLLKAACEEVLPTSALENAGAAGPVERGLYQLQYCRLKTASTAG